MIELQKAGLLNAHAPGRIQPSNLPVPRSHRAEMNCQQQLMRTGILRLMLVSGAVMHAASGQVCNMSTVTRPSGPIQVPREQRDVDLDS